MYAFKGILWKFVFKSCVVVVAFSRIYIEFQNLLHSKDVAPKRKGFIRTIVDKLFYDSAPHLTDFNGIVFISDKQTRNLVFSYSRLSSNPQKGRYTHGSDEFIFVFAAAHTIY